MRRLILMRHAKSDWDDPSLSDHDRPLNSRGRKAARALGRWLREQDLIPDTALISTATRTRETWEGLVSDWSSPPEATFLRELYHAEPDAMLAVLRKAETPTLLLLGHNPGLAELAHLLVAEAPDHPKFARYPTGATLVADFDTEGWGEIRPGAARTIAFVVPRDLG